ncbi:PP0621 family protein [Pseudomonas sp. NPDC089734]|uniref:PP0621 family protein n=1 Tax=Pseudomonas sp. NPDC089734 TaxID=3364469 RepID=UPI0038150620
MVRLIMWVALIAAAVWFIKRLLNPPAPRKPAEPPEADASPMVRCAHCGVHLPRDRALSQEQQWYCSEAHRLEGPATRDR